VGSFPAIVAIHNFVLFQNATTVVIATLSIANPVTTEFTFPEPVPVLIFAANRALMASKEIITHSFTPIMAVISSFLVVSFSFVLLFILSDLLIVRPASVQAASQVCSIIASND
tara:strand:+ start:1653 stop:1994 length:342 start_codon:yes stop_codon:yes gene_type:complete